MQGFRFAGVSSIGRIKAILCGLGIGLAIHTSASSLEIYFDHAPKCSARHCVADFAALYTGARLIRESPGALYDPDEQLARQRQIAPAEQSLPFVYPPITALALSPLSWFSFSHAFLLMALANFILIVQSIRLLIRHLNLGKDQSQWLGLFALCNFGAQATVFLGQTSAVLLYIFTRHILAQAQHRHAAAGASAGWLCLKPQFFTLPFLISMVCRRWREAITAAIVGGAITFAGFLWIGIDASRQYFQLIQDMAVDTDWTHPVRYMHNLRALTSYWLPAEVQAYAWWAGTGLVVGSTIVFNWRAHERADDFAGRWIVMLLAVLIVAPHLFTHDLTLLILPCALFLSLFKENIPLSIGLGLISLALLPVVNYLLPTLVAFTLVVLYSLGVTFGVTNWPASHLADGNREVNSSYKVL